MIHECIWGRRDPAVFRSVLLKWVLVFGVVTLILQRNATAESLEKRSQTGLLLVANKTDRSLGIIDPVAGRQVAAVALDGITGHEVAASPDGSKAFVPIFGSGGVGGAGTDGSLLRVVDIARAQVVGTVDFGKGVRPHCAQFGPKDGMLYVTTELDNSVTVIDPVSLKIVKTIPTGQPESHMLAITRDGRRGYTSNVGPGTVSVLDLEAGKLVTVIQLSTVAQRICLSVDDKLVFTADQKQPRLAVIDATTNQVKNWVPLPGKAYGTAATPDGKWLLVALIGNNQVAAVNLASWQVEHTLDVPKAPQEIVLRPDGQEAYVSCDASAQIAVLSFKDFKVAKLIQAGAGADGLAWASSGPHRLAGHGR